MNFTCFELDSCNTFQRSWARGVFTTITSPFLLTTLRKCSGTLIVEPLEVESFPSLAWWMISVRSLRCRIFLLRNVPHVFTGRQVWTTGRPDSYPQSFTVKPRCWSTSRMGLGFFSFFNTNLLNYPMHVSLSLSFCLSCLPLLLLYPAGFQQGGSSLSPWTCSRFLPVKTGAPKCT